MNIKPPPIIIDVAGIEAKPIVMNEINIVDWNRLLEFPPFQMYMNELSGMPFENISDWVVAFLVKQIEMIGESQLLKQYQLWHKSKGMWPNEDEFGDIHK